jgi:TM2 domain-containing membrane protein YozV
MSSQPYPNAQAIFYQQYAAVRRDEVVGVLLALFLGCFGLHHFYLRRTGLGILYICLTFTVVGAFFTWFVSFIECFFMPGRVREFNAIQAAGIAATLGIAMPGWGYPLNVTVNVPPAPQPGTLVACGRCGQTYPQGTRFCSRCGTGL